VRSFSITGSCDLPSDRELGSAVAEDVELVAVEIAEVAGIEAVTALGA
jgi:hypothetical protein